jgi:hypothetical protein
MRDQRRRSLSSIRRDEPLGLEPGQNRLILYFTFPTPRYRVASRYEWACVLLPISESARQAHGA